MVMECFRQTSAIRSWDFTSPRRLNGLEYVRDSTYRGGRKFVPSIGLSKSCRFHNFKECPLRIKKIIMCYNWHQNQPMGKTEESCRDEGLACFMSISATTQAPQRLTTARDPLPRHVTTLGVMFSMAAITIWAVRKSESYARDRLISDRKAPVPSQSNPQVITAYDRAKASVAQTACVTRAVAALRTNHLIECTLEMELALEENRIARTCIETDFYVEDELLQVYRSCLKIWLDGYPLDYGKILQLRSVLDIHGEKAERLEEEVRGQSDAYVI